MTIMKHELRQGKKLLIIWTAAVALFLVICMLMFPEMKGQMDAMSSLFSAMGAFTAAFGMDKLDFGSLTGFYALECGNIIGLGGAFFAALIASSALAKEEKEHTAEYLFTHPVTRKKVITGKLAAILIQILILNIIVYLAGILSMVLIGETIPWKIITLLHFAYLIVQIVIAGLCFGISALIRSNGFGIGIGAAVGFYFLNIVANISESAKFLKHFTPFGFSDGADIVSSNTLNAGMILVDLAVAALAVAGAYYWYDRKDLL